jgi:predicted N-formylglutamate amidohydrolase
MQARRVCWSTAIVRSIRRPSFPRSAKFRFPGNRNINNTERQERVRTWFKPLHAAIVAGRSPTRPPASLGGLGIARDDLDRHIGIDIGILPVAEQVSDLICAPLVFQRYSRLVVECNRRWTAPDIVAAVSDGTPVPANIGVGEAERERRIEEIFVPYHREIARRLAQPARDGTPTVPVSMHSFTPSLLSAPAPRPWQIGVCYETNDALSGCILKVLETEPGLNVGNNQPYGVDVETSYSVPVYGEEQGHPYAESEIRQDLISDRAGQRQWGQRIARVLLEAHSLFRQRS